MAENSDIRGYTAVTVTAVYGRNNNTAIYGRTWPYYTVYGLGVCTITVALH